MKTADEMIKYIKKNGFKRSGYSIHMLRSRAELVAKQLFEEEEVLTCFIGQSITDQTTRNFPSIFFTPFTFAYGDVCFVALTNRRLIEAKINNLFIKEKNVLTIELTYLNDITQNKYFFTTQIKIDTINEQARYIMFNRYGSITYKNFQKAYAKIKENEDKTKGLKKVKSSENTIEYVESSFEKKMKKDPKLAMNQVKELFDEGLISKEQHDKKIEEILKEI